MMQLLLVEEAAFYYNVLHICSQRDQNFRPIVLRCAHEPHYPGLVESAILLLADKNSVMLLYGLEVCALPALQ